jgi:RNA ligase
MIHLEPGSINYVGDPPPPWPGEFEEFPKIPRFSRGVVVTEKIDGTNACVKVEADGTLFFGSRTRWITPASDNFGFAAWGTEHAAELLTLGPGTHFGEWWGQGIQRGYGLKEKRFSLFNVARWGNPDKPAGPLCCHVVPVLWRGNFDDLAVDFLLDSLELFGSKAAPGFMDPEGIVIFHTAGNLMFKKTLEKDDTPKSTFEKGVERLQSSYLDPVVERMRLILEKHSAAI